jgi:superfamily II DNA or RNA helicase
MAEPEKWCAAITTASKGAKRAKVVPDPNKNPFKAVLAQLHPNLALLRKALKDKRVGEKCTMSTAYKVPLNALDSDTLHALITELRTKPKPVYFRGTRVDNPWPLFVKDDTHLSLPRALGYALFGRAGTIDVTDRPVLFPPPKCDLLDAESAAKVYKSDQETYVATLVHNLETMAGGPAGFGGAMYCIPTGHGKGASAVHTAVKLGQRMLFVALSESLFDQFESEFKKFLGDDIVVGRVWTSNRKAWKNPDADIVLTTVSSAASCNIPIDEFGLVVIDESHLASTEKRKDLFFRVKAKYIMLMTATPERSSDHCGAYQEWLGGPMSTFVRIDFANNRWGGVDVVTQPITYTTPIKESFDTGKDGRSYTNTDKLLAVTMYHKQRNAAIVKRVAQYVREQGRHFVLVGVRIWHVETIAKLLNAQGVEAGVLVGSHTDGKAQTHEERRENRTKQNLVAYVSLAAQALDVPKLDSFAFISGGVPWSNETFLIQGIGRIIRDVESGKNRPMVLFFDDETAPKGYFSKQVAKTKDRLRALGDGFHFVDAEPIHIC